MKLTNVILCASLATLPLLAHAGDLKIANRTKFDLSFKINNICSDRFGNVSTDTIKIVVEKDFNKECGYNPKFCRTIVYGKPNCKGENIAGIGFDTSHGVIYISGST